MFVISLVISVAVCGLLVFSNWMASANKTAESIATDVNKVIYDNVFSFILRPYQINELNHKVFENDIMYLYDDVHRERYFTEILGSHGPEMYSFSYGTAEGEFYGAQRNEKGEIEIMRSDYKTGGKILFYSLKDDLTAGEQVGEAGLYDPRTRPWYKAAEEAGKPVFSPVFKHFFIEDLAVSAACPVYNEDGRLKGVIGTHLLLSGIGEYLQEAVSKYNGLAIIIENGSGTLVANSMGVKNFSYLENGQIKRLKLDELGNSDIQKAYEHYKANGRAIQLYRGEKDNYYVSVGKIRLEGIDWTILSAVPESIFVGDVKRSIGLTIFIAALASVISVTAFHIIMRIYLKPLNDLLKVSEEFSRGNLSRRAEIIRNDEIGLISGSFNTVADKMQSLIDNLETAVQERTEELYRANKALEESRSNLRLILDSAAEAIFGLDLNGNCTFCNESCVKMLGYSSQEELLGRNMHQLIHHTRKEGTPIPVEECRILKSIETGQGFSADDEVFWKADGTPMNVEYHSYPQIKDGKVLGVVVTFMDITERYRREEEIRYLSCHDVLTGLYNRRYFDEYRNSLDTQENLPLSVIFADINGLKMTNDIFGHSAGDKLIKKSAEILRKSCRQEDIIARMGGDEFIILLPRTEEKDARKVLNRIREGFANARIEAIKCSISLGLDTKSSPDQSLDEVLANAENVMYKDKTMNREFINKDIIDTLIETLHTRNPRERRHSVAVSEMCTSIGKALGLPETEIKRLGKAGYLHDIGKITLDKNTIDRAFMTEDEQEMDKTHSISGYRILNLFDDTLDLAEYVYSHHERWDGTGSPRGLKGEEIPLIARIISVAETYDRVLNRGEQPLHERKKTAAGVIREGAGTQFDPHIAELFLKLIDDSGPVSGKI